MKPFTILQRMVGGAGMRCKVQTAFMACYGEDLRARQIDQPDKTSPRARS